MNEWRRMSEPDYVSDARINELIGLCKGVLADGALVHEEATFLLQWLELNRQLANSWPGNLLYERIGLALQDGVLDAEEERELIGLLADFSRVESAGNAPTYLPLCNPPPRLSVVDQIFCLTGTFEYGKRSLVVELLESIGGQFTKSFSGKVNVLVIGNLVTPAWVHATYGRKIEAAANARASGLPISIVNENHLLDELRRVSAQ